MIPLSSRFEVLGFLARYSTACFVAASAFGCESNSANVGTEQADVVPGSKLGNFGLTPAQLLEPLIVVGERSLSLGAAAELMGPPPKVRRRPPESSRRRAFVEEQLQLELLSVQARRDGLFAAEDSIRLRDRLAAQVVMDETRRSIAAVTAKEVQALYESDPLRFTVPSRASVLHLVVGDKKRAIRIAELLGPTPNAIEFGAIARSESLDKRSKQHSGRLGVLTKPNAVSNGAASKPEAVDAVSSASWLRLVAPEVTTTVFESESAGQLLGPIRSKQGYHLIVVLKRWPERLIPLADVRGDLADELELVAGKKVVDALVKKLRVEYNVQLTEPPRGEGENVGPVELKGNEGG